MYFTTIVPQGSSILKCLAAVGAVVAKWRPALGPTPALPLLTHPKRAQRQCTTHWLSPGTEAWWQVSGRTALQHFHNTSTSSMGLSPALGQIQLGPKSIIIPNEWLDLKKESTNLFLSKNAKLIRTHKAKMFCIIYSGNLHSLCFLKCILGAFNSMFHTLDENRENPLWVTLTRSKDHITRSQWISMM